MKLSALLACLGALLPAATALAADFAGTWQNTHPQALLRPDNAKAPPFLPAAAAAYSKSLAAYRAHDLDFDPTQKCKAPGLTRLLTGAMPFQIVTTPQQVLTLWQWNHLASWAKMNAAPDPTMFATYQGNAVAHADGDTLTIDSTGFNQFTFLDAGGMPHSDKLQVEQVLHLTAGGKQMRDDVTITDPDTFSAPWTTTLTFRRLPPHTRLALDTCEDRIKGLNGYY